MRAYTLFPNRKEEITFVVHLRTSINYEQTSSIPVPRLQGSTYCNLISSSDVRTNERANEERGRNLWEGQSGAWPEPIDGRANKQGATRIYKSQ